MNDEEYLPNNIDEHGDGHKGSSADNDKTGDRGNYPIWFLTAIFIMTCLLKNFVRHPLGRKRLEGREAAAVLGGGTPEKRGFLRSKKCAIKTEGALC